MTLGDFYIYMYEIVSKVFIILKANIKYLLKLLIYLICTRNFLDNMNCKIMKYKKVNRLKNNVFTD